MNLSEFRKSNIKYFHLPSYDLAMMLYQSNPEFKDSGVSFEDFADRIGTEEDRISRLPERGHISELGHAIPRGVRGGMAMGLKAAHVAGEETGLPEVLYPSEQYIEEVEKKTETDPFYQKGQLAEGEGVFQDVVQGVESAATSMTTMVPGGAIGIAKGVAGGPVGTVAGGIAGAATSGGLIFGAAEYYDFMKTAEDMLMPIYTKKYTQEGYKKDDAAQLAVNEIHELASPQAFKSAVAEGGFEGLSNIIDLLIVKGGMKAVSGPIKQGIKAKFLSGLKKYTSNVGKLALSEVPTEMATGATQAEAYKPIYEAAGEEAPSPSE
jgi:hypothetical protein